MEIRDFSHKYRGQVDDLGAVGALSVSSGNRAGDNGRGYNGGTEEGKEPKKQGVRNAQKIDNPLLPRLLSLKAAAVYMGRTTWGMRELYWANKIPWLKDGKKIYFDVKDLDAYIERCKTTFA